MMWCNLKRNLDTYMNQFVLNYASSLVNVTDCFDERMAKPSVPSIENTWKQNPTDPILFGFLARHCNGGMHGDMALLSLAAFAYTVNPEFVVDVPPITRPIIIHLTYEEFTPDDILLEAVDFHCSDIIKCATKVFPQPQDVLRKWMWDYRSGFNVRKPWTKRIPPIQWEEILKFIDDWSREKWKESMRVNQSFPSPSSSSSLLLLLLLPSPSSLPSSLPSSKHKHKIEKLENVPKKYSRQSQITDFLKK